MDIQTGNGLIISIHRQNWTREGRIYKNGKKKISKMGQKTMGKTPFSSLLLSHYLKLYLSYYPKRTKLPPFFLLSLLNQIISLFQSPENVLASYLQLPIFPTPLHSSLVAFIAKTQGPLSSR